MHPAVDAAAVAVAVVAVVAACWRTTLVDSVQMTAAVAVSGVVVVAAVVVHGM